MTPRYATLQFNPDRHQHAKLKTFSMSQQREINTFETNVNDTSEEETATYQLNIWNIETSQNPPKFSTALKNDL